MDMTYKSFFKVLREVSRTKRFEVMLVCGKVELKSGKKRKCYVPFHKASNGALLNPFSAVWQHLNPKKPLVAISSVAAQELLPPEKAEALVTAWQHMKGFSKPLRERMLKACRIEVE